jgi:hypothetical protein
MKLVRGSNRERVGAGDAEALRRAGTLVEDDRRERPLWFDGRFLAARDLVREQQYFLTREADLGRAAGSGVAVGLGVAPGAGPRQITVGAGHGVTPAGELVLLERPLTLDLADIPRAEKLSGKFGLGRIPLPPMRSRSGLFALALRPVEFTANPVGAYPTSITGERTVEDGDIIEGSALVLVPWLDDAATDSLDLRRGRAARTIFVDQESRGLPADVLPLAMVALENNAVAWIDVPMLRRALGADRNDLPGLGLAPRALRYAHVLQHQAHVADVLAARGRGGFSAGSVFPALPPAGPLPPGVVDPGDFSQSYFPASVDVDFSIVPEDELPALVEESLALPPLDLTASEESLDSTSVLILAPVPRSEWRAVLARIEKVTRRVRPAAPNRVVARQPLEVLMRLRPGRVIAPPLDPGTPSDAEWQRLARLDTLWYVRRRNLAHREDVTGTAQRLAGREARLTDARLREFERLGLRDLVDATLERATPGARTEIAHLLASSRVADSPALTAATLGELSRAERLDLATVLKTESVVTAPETGRGLVRLDEAGVTGERDEIDRIVNDPDWRVLDRAARIVERDSLPGLRDLIRRGGGGVVPR